MQKPMKIEAQQHGIWNNGSKPQNKLKFRLSAWTNRTVIHIGHHTIKTKATII